MLMDKITETIAHFIGLFDITLEQARLRKAYQEFKASQALADEQPDLPNHTVTVKPGYDFVGFDPYVPYLPVKPELVPLQPWTYVTYNPPEIPEGDQRDIVHPGFILPQALSWATGTSGRIVAQPTIDPPGSVAVYINQEIFLNDNDYVGVGGHGLIFSPAVDHSLELAKLVEAASDLSPLIPRDIPGSSAEIAAFITETTIALKNYSEEGHGNADVFVAKGSVIEGIFVNGEITQAVPNLDDYLQQEEEPEPEREGEDSFEYGGADGGTPDPVNSASGGTEQGAGEVSIEVSVELQIGGNTLVNTAAITNNWMAAGVVAVMGDHTELNAIVQINAWCDSDLVSSVVNGWTLDESDITQAFNIAMFRHDDLPTKTSGPAASAGHFPQNWVVSEIKGDLLIMNWIKQFSFVTDNDVAVLSSSGVTSSVILGDNTAVNEISLEELGQYYDLIIVGGNVYDANLIFQKNVLLDNDLIGAVAGFETTGAGSVSTSGNLLWNQGSIVNIGAADRFSALPDAYRDAATGLGNGKKDPSDDILQDEAFAGLSTLRVLYISGDFLNLQYIEQTNILGDNDQVALAMNALNGYPEADWTLSTGANNLINLAGIADVDAGAKTYVGGGVYSDEILIQAELISAEPDLGAQNPDVLVNEAVAFLDDDMAAANGGVQPAVPNPILPDTANADPMHTMLG
jgi:hypothetical protein